MFCRKNHAYLYYSSLLFTGFPEQHPRADMGWICWGVHVLWPGLFILVRVMLRGEVIRYTRFTWYSVTFPLASFRIFWKRWRVPAFHNEDIKHCRRVEISVLNNNSFGGDPSGPAAVQQILFDCCYCYHFVLLWGMLRSSLDLMGLFDGLLKMLTKPCSFASYL